MMMQSHFSKKKKVVVVGGGGGLTEMTLNGGIFLVELAVSSG